jgi:hypothetical protein
VYSPETGLLLWRQAEQQGDDAVEQHLALVPGLAGEGGAAPERPCTKKITAVNKVEGPPP